MAKDASRNRHGLAANRMHYSQAIYLVLSCILLFKIIRRDYDLLHTAIFVLPFHSWFYNLGLNLTVYQILTLLMLFQAAIRRRNLLYVGNKNIVLFFLYAVLNTVIISVFFVDEFRILGGFFRSEGRFVAQIALLMISLSIIPLAFNYIKVIEDVRLYLKTYLSALSVLSFLGWVQYLVYSSSAVDIFPLSVDAVGRFHSGLYAFEGSNIFRMSSLGGEPKGFSMSLIMGASIIHIFNRNRIYFFRHDVALKYIFAFTAFATLSTSGAVLFAILLFVYIAYQSLKAGASIRLNSKRVLYGMGLFILTVSLLGVYWGTVAQLVEQRVFDRTVLSEDFDAVIQIFLSEFPGYLVFGAGLGNIHNLAYPYVPVYWMHYMGDSIFVAKSGYLKLISELGVVGLSMFLIMVHGVYWRLGGNKKYASPRNFEILNSLQLLLLIALVAYLSRAYLSAEMFLILAIANVLVAPKEFKVPSRSHKARRTIFGITVPAKGPR